MKTLFLLLQEMVIACKRPLLPFATGLLGGIYCSYSFGWQWWAVTLALSGLAGIMLREKNPSARFWVWVASGWILAAVAVFMDLQLREREFQTLASTPREVGYLCKIGGRVRVVRQKLLGVCYHFSAETFLRADELGSADRMRVSVRWYDEHPAYGGRVPQPGEVWRIQGTLQWSRSRRGECPEIRVNTSWRGAERAELPSDNRWMNRIAAFRKSCFSRAEMGIEDWGVIPSLNQAMLLGTRSQISESMRRIFADSGTIHVFAISGMHIVLIASVMILVISMTGLPRHLWVFVLAPLLIFYTMATGAPPSAVRACLMSILYYAAPVFGRKSDALSVLAFTAVLVYGYRPGMVYDAGCQLSFLVMAGLVLFCQPSVRFFERLLRVQQCQEKLDLYRAAHARAKIWVWKIFYTFLRFFAADLAVTCAAWLVSVPLTAYYFGRFTPGGLLANLVVAPASFGVMLGGLLGVVSSFFSPLLASIFHHAAGGCTWMMIVVARFAAEMPGGSFRVQRWPEWIVVLWFFILFLLSIRLSQGNRQGDQWLR